MAVQPRIAAVTGANKGIGLAIVRQLALQHPTSPLASRPLLIYLTARSPSRGREALNTLTSDPQLKQAQVLTQDGGSTTIHYHAVDIAQPTSIQDFRAFLQTEHPAGIDIVINNAGIALEGFDAGIVHKTLQTNYFGTLETCQSLLPLLREGGRLVNVSSMSGKLNKYSDEIRAAFVAAATEDVAAVTAIMQRFQQAVEAGKEKEEGFPSIAYGVSKAGETAYTKALAREEAWRKKNILINACCPGYVNTDMTKGRGRKTPDQGAQTPVMLALRDIGGKTGEFWQHEEVVEW